MKLPTVTSTEDLTCLIDDIGFLPFFQNDIAGFSLEDCVDRRFWFPDKGDGVWEWKGPVIQRSGCAYGKFFRGKAGFISADWYPDFANYRRDGYDFDARYEDGLARHKDKTVYDVLLAYPSLISKEWRKKAGTQKRGEFDAIVTRLQMLGYITTADFEYAIDKYGKPYGWGLARYATPESFFGNTFSETVYQCDPRESKEKILRHLSALFPLADEKKLLKMIEI